MIDSQRLVGTFLELTAIDAESGEEAEIREAVLEKLAERGIRGTVDRAGNIVANSPGSILGEPILFSSHLDTVRPGKGKHAVVLPGGKITSDGTTILGADDAAGLAAILEALAVIRERKLPHRDLELMFPVMEEIYGKGSRNADFGAFRAKTAYVLDLTGRIGTAALAAPTILSLEIEVRGRAAHAGFAPETGVNALKAASIALAELETGRVAEDTTVNFGIIRGGTGVNIVPAEVTVRGEIRSMRHEEALRRAEKVKEVFLRSAGSVGAAASITVSEEVHAYRIDPAEEVAERFARACRENGLGSPEYVDTFGGSDNNNFCLHGIRGIVLASAMNDVHTTAEYTEISELEHCAELVLKLMVMGDAD